MKILLVGAEFSKRKDRHAERYGEASNRCWSLNNATKYRSWCSWIHESQYKSHRKNQQDATV